MLNSARRRRSRSPRRSKSPRNRKKELADKGEKLPCIDIRWLYVFFLSARHLHFVASVCLVLACSVGLLTLIMTFDTTCTIFFIVPLLAVVCLDIAWYCFLRPPVVASSPSRTNYFQPAGGRFPSFPTGSSKKSKIYRQGNDIVMTFPPIYVAHTGYFDENGSAIYGLYAGSKISQGCCFMY